MSEFYNYISRIVIKYLDDIHIVKGERFSIQLERQVDVNNIYESLRRIGDEQSYLVEDFDYDRVYHTYSIKINNTRLIIAKSDQDISSDFLTFLRNHVDKNGTVFQGTALLFLHNTNLDSILGGSKRLEMEGMPLHVRSIEKKLFQDINDSTLSAVDKTILEIYLEQNRNNVYESHASIFDYTEIFNILEKKFIDPAKYKDFGMFEDAHLTTYNMLGVDEALKKRIKDNMELFKSIDQIHKYSDLSELEQYFDKSDLPKLENPDWVSNNYDEIVKWIEKYKKSTKPNYSENTLKSDNPDLILWDKPEGLTAAKARKRHILVFNSNRAESVTINFKFDAKIKEDSLKATNNIIPTYNNKTISLAMVCDKAEPAHVRMDYFNFTFYVMVLNCEPELLSEIEDKFYIDLNQKKKIRRIMVIDDSKKLTLNPGKAIVEEQVLNMEKNCITIDINTTINLLKEYQDLDEAEIIDLEIDYNGSMIPLAFKNELIHSIRISPYDVWKDKKILERDFTYEKDIDPQSRKERVQLTQGTRSYYPTGEFRRLLDFEAQIIKSDGIHFELNNNVLIEKEIALPEDLLAAYQELINYYKHRDILPSLATYSLDLVKIANHYIEIYFSYLKELEIDSDQRKDQYKEINKLGVIYENDGERKIHFTPLHPINLMYQIKASAAIANEDVEKGIMQYIGATNLVPYIQDITENFFKPIDNGLVEWSTYVEYDNSKYNASNRYVSRIVSNKINDFVVHFDYLFISDYAPIKIGLVNLGDCREILQGVFEYYINELKTQKIEDLKPIEIHIYDDEQTISAFEELTGYVDLKKIQEVFELKLKTKEYDEYDVLSMYRSNVHFYKYPLNKIEYNHLTFYKMNDKVVMGSKNMADIVSGICLDGLVSDVASVFVGKEYVTGFGSRNLVKDNDPFIENIILYNSFVEYINHLVTYDKKTVLATAISAAENEVLQRIYEKSHWVTFIDPKVDLNYFATDEDCTELMIIHYSDQYTSSSGYDAITVTQRASVYMKIIDDFLAREAKLPVNKNRNIREIINSFNVFNGEWLLRLVSRQLANKRDQFAREKLSIFSAVKLFEAYNLNTDVFWIPISLEELVRVSGSTGLTQKDSIFSPKKVGITGSFSDDILMIGISVQNNEVVVSYYPIEVKIGNNGNNVLTKAKDQVSKASAYLNSELFKEDTFYAKLLRNQLMQMAVVQIKKIIMYGLWKSKDWSYLLNEEIIKKLANDNYIIQDRVSDKINDCGIITFTTNAITRRIQKIQHNGITIDYFDYPLQDAHSYLAMDLVGVCIINKWDHSLDNNPVLPVEPGENNVSAVQPVSGTKPIDGPVVPIALGGPNQAGGANIPVKAPVQPFVISQTEMRILFGKDQITQDDVYWFPNSTDKVMHTNTGIIGTMGTGKTQFTKSLITQIKQQQKYNVDGKEIGILIFDYKGDYVKDDFVEATGATVYQLYNLPFNPLSIFQGKTFKPMLPLHTANELRDTIANSYSLGNVQKNTLSDILEEAYNSVGILAHVPETWSKDAPTIDTVFRTYMAGENSTGDSLYAALNELTKFQIFEADSSKTKPLFELVKGVTVINLAGYSESIQNLVVAITLDTFYAQMQSQGHSVIKGDYRQLTRMILVDEADNFLGKDFNSIKKILKEGREFGVGTILSTQFLKHFATSDNNFSEYILTWIIHKVNEITAKEVGNIFSMTNKNEQDYVVTEIKNLRKHHSIINLGGDNVPKHIRDLAFWELKN